MGSKCGFKWHQHIEEKKKIDLRGIIVTVGLSQSMPFESCQ